MKKSSAPPQFKDLGSLLKWFRKKRRVTQYSLATAINLDYRHYQNIESGMVNVRIETVSKICRHLGIRLYVFFYLLDKRAWESEEAEVSKDVLLCIVDEAAQIALD